MKAGIGLALGTMLVAAGCLGPLEGSPQAALRVGDIELRGLCGDPASMRVWVGASGAEDLRDVRVEAQVLQGTASRAIAVLPLGSLRQLELSVDGLDVCNDLPRGEERAVMQVDLQVSARNSAEARFERYVSFHLSRIEVTKVSLSDPSSCPDPLAEIGIQNLGPHGAPTTTIQIVTENGSMRERGTPLAVDVSRTATMALPLGPSCEEGAEAEVCLITGSGSGPVAFTTFDITRVHGTWLVGDLIRTGSQPADVCHKG